MSSLRDDLDNYLHLRRHLGHDLADAARLLPRFIDYLAMSGPDHGHGEPGSGVVDATRRSARKLRATQTNDRRPRLRPLPQRPRPRY
jgi:hypothetical protein